MPNNQNSTVKLSRRRLLTGVATAGVATTATGAGTFAALNDTESSEDNTVQAGTLDLNLANGGAEYWWDVGPGEPGGTASGSNGGFTAQLHNFGSVEGDHLEIDFENIPIEDDNGEVTFNDDGTVSGANPGPDSDSDTSPSTGAEGMAKWVEVRNVKYKYINSDGNEVVIDLVGSDRKAIAGSGLSDTNDANNDIIDLADLAANGAAFDNLPVPPSGGAYTTTPDGDEAVFNIDVGIRDGMPNKYQGDVLRTKVTFGLYQDSTDDNP